MHPQETVIVVGAGASQEAGLPTSTALKRSIASCLDIRFQIMEQISGDRTIAASLQTLTDINQYLRACWTIRDALPQAMSIDNFIEAHQENRDISLCGKLAIVRTILEAEKNSTLYINRTSMNNRLDFESLEETWFNMFWQRISENCQAKELRDRLLSIVLIVFNYDRCIEHFLFHALQNYYVLSADDAASLVDTMRIYHPYGQVGSLPWTIGSEPMEFGAEPNARNLMRLAEQIKTFTEGTNPEASDIEIIRNHVAEASTLVFLGFAYHQQNLELLKRPNEDSTNEQDPIMCYGTSFGISDPDLGVISSQLREFCGASLVLNENKNLTCSELFNTYRRTLSFV